MVLCYCACFGGKLGFIFCIVFFSLGFFTGWCFSIEAINDCNLAQVLTAFGRNQWEKKEKSTRKSVNFRDPFAYGPQKLHNHTSFILKWIPTGRFR